MAKPRAAMRAKGGDDLSARPAIEFPVGLEDQAPDPYADETKWPAWKVTIAVILFCGAFWAGIGYLIFRLLG